MSVAALNYATTAINGLTRKIKLQNVADKVRLITLPTSGRYRITVGPLFGTDGKTLATANYMGYSLGPTGTFTNNASSPSVVDEAVMANLDIGESREICLGFVESERPKELILWADLADTYVELTFDAVEGR